MTEANDDKELIAYFSKVRDHLASLPEDARRVFVSRLEISLESTTEDPVRLMRRILEEGGNKDPQLVSLYARVVLETIFGPEVYDKPWGYT